MAVVIAMSTMAAVLEEIYRTQDSMTMTMISYIGSPRPFAIYQLIFVLTGLMALSFCFLSLMHFELHVCSVSAHVEHTFIT